nr:phage tail protein [Snodgrassella gandavensis]
MYFARDWAPTGWLKANGATVSRTAYAGLFAVLGTYYGAGDGSTTFNLPDLRGEFIRSYDDRRGVDPGRWLGRRQGDAIRNITGACSGAMGVVIDSFAGAFFDNGARDATAATSTTKVTYNDDFCFDASRVVPTANENRPRNIALLACIKV